MTAWLVESAFRSLLMATLVWTCIKVLRLRNVAVQKTAWILVLFFSVAMPALQRWSLPQSKAAVVVPVHQLMSRATSEQPAYQPVQMARAPRSTAITIQPAVASEPSGTWQWKAIPWKRLIVPTYLSVVGILLLRLFIGLFLACRIWSRAEDASVLLDPRANVRISDDIETPVTIGSTIVLPESHALWNQQKLRVVLAHERSHVHQLDFYLQLLAGAHAVIFWFSPLAWWLKKELSDLGEAISDRAALVEAQSRTTYAEVLVEFASLRRYPLAGVAMARSSNLRRRVDRLLIDQKFRNAFTSRRWHYSAVAIVPLALVAAVTLVRVQAAEAMPRVLLQPVRAVVAAVPAVKPMAAIAQAEPPAQEKATSSASHKGSYTHLSDDDQNSYAIVNGDSRSFSGSGEWNEKFTRMADKQHGNYILFERDGKSYMIDDPALVSEAHSYFAPMEELGRQQGELGSLQGKLGEQQARLGALQSEATAPPPDFSKELAAAQKALAALQGQKLQADLKQVDLSDLQEKLAEVQSHLAEMQGKFGDAQARIGEKQAELGEQQAKLGEKQAEFGRQQAALGEKQAAIAEEASRKMKSLIDSAMQNGKAHPVE